MSVTISNGSDTATAYLTGEIDHHTAAIIRADIDSAIEKQHPGTLVIDFSGVTFTDSSGIGLVLGRYKFMSAMGGKVCVTGLDSRMYKVMCLAGLDKLVALEKKEEKR